VGYLGYRPAGLAAAIRIKQLCMSSGTELSVGVVEKASEVGTFGSDLRNHRRSMRACLPVAAAARGHAFCSSFFLGRSVFGQNDDSCPPHVQGLTFCLATCLNRGRSTSCCRGGGSRVPRSRREQPMINFLR
jgi:hypothetical protein